MAKNSNKSTSSRTWILTGVGVAILNLLYIAITRLALGWGEYEDFFLPVIILLCALAALISTQRNKGKNKNVDKKED